MKILSTLVGFSLTLAANSQVYTNVNAGTCNNDGEAFCTAFRKINSGIDALTNIVDVMSNQVYLKSLPFPTDYKTVVLNPDAILTLGGTFDADLCQEADWHLFGPTNFIYYACSSNNVTCAICAAQGENLNNLTKLGPVPGLLGSNGTWNASGDSGPRLFEDDDGTLAMYFFAGSSGGFESAPTYIGEAESRSPFGPFTNYVGNPIISTLSGWTANQYFRPFVKKWQGIYYLFCNAANASAFEQIGVFTAPTRHGPFSAFSGNPVITNGFLGTNKVLDPVIYDVKGGFVMIYTGANSSGQHGLLAFSTNLLNWTPLTTEQQFPGYVNGTPIRSSWLRNGSRFGVLYDNQNNIYSGYGLPEMETVTAFTWFNPSTNSHNKFSVNDSSVLPNANNDYGLWVSVQGNPIYGWTSLGLGSASEQLLGGTNLHSRLEHGFYSWGYGSSFQTQTGDTNIMSLGPYGLTSSVPLYVQGQKITNGSGVTVGLFTTNQIVGGLPINWTNTTGFKGWLKACYQIIPSTNGVNGQAFICFTNSNLGIGDQIGYFSPANTTVITNTPPIQGEYLMPMNPNDIAIVKSLTTGGGGNVALLGVPSFFADSTH